MKEHLAKLVQRCFNCLGDKNTIKRVGSKKTDTGKSLI